MKKKFIIIKWIYPSILLLVNLIFTNLTAQKGLTLEQALTVAESNSPTVIKTRLSLIRSQENLNVQLAGLKSKFALSVNPLTYSQNRAFNTSTEIFNTSKSIRSSGVFTVVQPILPTDATTTLSDKFSYTNTLLNEQYPRSVGIIYNNDV